MIFKDFQYSWHFNSSIFQFFRSALSDACRSATQGDACQSKKAMVFQSASASITRKPMTTHETHPMLERQPSHRKLMAAITPLSTQPSSPPPTKSSGSARSSISSSVIGCWSKRCSASSGCSVPGLGPCAVRRRSV